MAKKTSKRKRTTSKTFEELYGRPLTEEEKKEIGKNLLQLGRALRPTKKPKKEE